MTTRTHVYLLALAIALLGLAIFAYKAFVLELPLEPGLETNTWTIEARLSFDADYAPIKATLRIPNSPPKYGILNEHFVSRGFGLTTSEDDLNREALWSRRRAPGPQALYYRVAVFNDPDAADARAPIDYPPVPELDEPFATALEDLVSDARARSADIASFSAQMLRQLNGEPRDESIALFLPGASSSLDKAKVAQTLLAGARIPSRIANGIALGGDTDSALVEPWLEVFNGDNWLNFDLDSGRQFDAAGHLTWYYGAAPLAEVTNARDLKTELFVRREAASTLDVAERRASRLGSHVFEFSLMELPIRTQAVYSVLLMIPLGALVMVLMRNVIGVPTFGTFTPILIALAFRETQLVYGIILFSLVVSMGLAVRFALERLRLLLVPRLSAVLVTVVMLLLLISLLSHRLDLETGLSVALFPMVILAMVIERMSIVWEERGPGKAMVEGAGSLAVAMVAYLVMSIDRLEHLMFVFPELLLVLLGFLLVMGRYTGYRVTELLRFNALAPKQPQKTG